MIDELKKLIEFKTLPENKKKNEDALNWVKSGLPKGKKTKIVKYEGYPSLIVGSDNPKICLQAHIDVVPGRVKDFSPRIDKENRLFGRGSYDMKFAIACYMDLLSEIDSDDVGVLITSDEEIGGFNGVKAVLNDGYDPKFCFLPDGGDDWAFDEKAKGVWHLKIDAVGKPGHASRPWEGDSALRKLIHFLRELEENFSSEAIHKETAESTINIGKIEGGDATNRIADQAYAKIDIRLCDNKEKDRIKLVLKELENKFEGVTIKEEVFGSAFFCDLKDPYFEIFSEEARSVGRRTRSQVAHGSSDARFFSEKGISTMMIKPKGGGSHSDKEWVDLDDLNNFSIALKRFVQKIIK